MNNPTWLVTGGAGFIGTNFVRHARRLSLARIINLDKLTYAGHLASLACVENDSGHIFVRGDIGDKSLVAELLERYQPQAIINFAAESHVDRSILSPDPFVETNVMGTCRLLQSCLEHWEAMPPSRTGRFRFLHISTDEVYGDLESSAPPVVEGSPYAPNSPYAASKAAGDHFVRAFHKTYGMPTITANSTNNYGPYQYPEKLIPLMIRCALTDKNLPVYGDGNQMRDWIYVEDNVEAILRVLESGRPGETYNIAGNEALTNLETVRAICDSLDQILPDSPLRPFAKKITFVADRPGHDRRYALDSGKIRNELGWKPKSDFKSGLARTVNWDLDNKEWCRKVCSDDYEAWLHHNYDQRT